MTTPSDPDDGRPPAEGVHLGKSESRDEPAQVEPAGGAPEPATGDPAGEAPFDPYRFGRPEHPVPAEYAPPGYTGPTAPPPGPYGAPPPQSGADPYAGGPPNPYGGGPPNPFANPPGTPYGGPPPQQPPYQYPPQPYGPGGPPPPAYHGYAQPRTGNGKAVAALVLGILSILFCWLSVFDAVFIILALIFGLLALSDAKKGRAGGRGMAIAGIACMVVGAILATIISVKVFRAVDRCGGFDHANDSSFNQCLRDNI